MPRSSHHDAYEHSYPWAGTHGGRRRRDAAPGRFSFADGSAARPTPYGGAFTAIVDVIRAFWHSTERGRAAHSGGAAGRRSSRHRGAQR